MKILADEIPAWPKGHDDVCSVTQCAFLYVNTINNAASTRGGSRIFRMLVKEVERRRRERPRGV